MSEQANRKDMTPGAFSWNELMSQDAKGSMEFYQKMFGWKTNSMDMPSGMRYHMFELGGGKSGESVGGLMQNTPEMDLAGMPTAWMPYVTVADVDAAAAKAQKLGAKICKDVTEIPMGRFAIIQDPQGAMIGLFEFGKGSNGKG